MCELDKLNSGRIDSAGNAEIQPFSKHSLDRGAHGVSAPGSKKRAKLWQLNRMYHCSVIGTCATLVELRQIARKYRIECDGPVTDYMLHCTFVSSAQEQSAPIRHLNKLLDKKYSRQIRLFARADSEEALKTLWRKAVQDGNIAGAYWSLITHPLCSEALFQPVFGEVHMLSHLSGASIRTDLREMATLRKNLNEKTDENAQYVCRLQERIADLEGEIRSLQEEVLQARVLKADLSAANARVANLESHSRVTQLEAVSENLAENLFTTSERMRTLEQKFQQSELQRIAADEERCRLQIVVKEKDGELSILEDVLADWLRSEPGNPCSGQGQRGCPFKDLNGQRILYVGGRSGQYPSLRALVEKNNGELMCHDGGLEESRLHLNAVLSRADVVF
ncbi:MAG: hypothetical protein MI864_00015, partial [Pseudomonadales bacterium]|nr:hypothetical protein [Pseudomonadales bacterium]